MDQILAKYREPIFSRSIFELAVTLAPFVAIWALAWWTLSISPWLAMALALANASFLVRLFMIQHDCGPVCPVSPATGNSWVDAFDKCCARG